MTNDNKLSKRHENKKIRNTFAGMALIIILLVLYIYLFLSEKSIDILDALWITIIALMIYSIFIYISNDVSINGVEIEDLTEEDVFYIKIASLNKKNHISWSFVLWIWNIDHKTVYKAYEIIGKDKYILRDFPGDTIIIESNKGCSRYIERNNQGYLIVPKWTITKKYSL